MIDFSNEQKANAPRKIFPKGTECHCVVSLSDAKPVAFGQPPYIGLYQDNATLFINLRLDIETDDGESGTVFLKYALPRSCQAAPGFDPQKADRGGRNLRALIAASRGFGPLDDPPADALTINAWTDLERVEARAVLGVFANGYGTFQTVDQWLPADAAPVVRQTQQALGAAQVAGPRQAAPVASPAMSAGQPPAARRVVTPGPTRQPVQQSWGGGSGGRGAVGWGQPADSAPNDDDIPF